MKAKVSHFLIFFMCVCVHVFVYATCVRGPVEARERVRSSRATVTKASDPPDVGAGNFKMIYFLALVESLN